MTSSAKPNSIVSDRRSFLARMGSLGLGVAASAPVAGVLMSSASGQAHAAQSIQLDAKAPRRIHLVNAHTGDDVEVVYFTRGMYIDENMAKLNYLMRDRRANVAAKMDTALYDQLLRIQIALNTDTPVHVLSGYRTPETNAKLRRRSSGVAKYSLHMEGRAADIYVPGIPVKKLRSAAVSLASGGVGLYSKSNLSLIHI